MNNLQLHTDPFLTEKLNNYIKYMNLYSTFEIRFFNDNKAISRIKLNKSSLGSEKYYWSFHNKINNTSKEFTVIHLNKIDILDESFYHSGIMTSTVSYLILKLLTCSEFKEMDFEIQLVDQSSLAKLNEPYDKYKEVKGKVYYRLLKHNDGNTYYQPLLKENRLEDIKYYTALFLEKGNIIYEQMPKDFFDEYKNKTEKLKEIEKNFINLETFLKKLKEQSLKTKCKLKIRKTYLNMISQIFPNKKEIIFGNKTFYKIKTIDDGRKLIPEVLLTYLQNNYEYESYYSVFDEDDYRYNISIFRVGFYRGYYGYDDFRIVIGSDRLIGKFICCDQSKLKGKKNRF